MNNIIIFPVIFFFLHTSPALQVTPIDWECCGFSKEVEKIFFQDDSLKTIYIIKQRWHTAVVFHTEDVSAIGGSASGGDSLIFPEIKYFKDTELIDIGWGDEAFYQHPDFDWDLAYHALFHATPSTLRVEGINITKQQYFDISEIVVELKINNEQLKILLKYISETIWRDENKNYEILSTQYLNRVYFFKANGSYHLFNTCNTWLARGLKQSGLDIKDDIVLTEQLFNEAAKIGKVLKAE
ncbi:MAG: DUF2459 domain-containing protein [Ignavibacteriaceae bacterium]|nr:DUF2459 domain-containing protein [Ignavibacteriaceae bacterium]